MNWGFLLILLITALICCAIGFKRFVWFLSIGYGFAVCGIAIVSLIYGFTKGMVSIPLAIGFVVMAIYGFRLGYFLYRREMGNKAYRKVLAAKMSDKEPPIFVKVAVWLCVGVLYVLQTCGLHFRMTNGSPDNIFLYIGIVIMILGAAMEAMADKQKSAQKKQRPDFVACQGLFKLVRCPNYFGEILFWTGVCISGITAYNGILQWACAIIGYACIVYIMVDGAKRMEKGHIQRYGHLEEYQKYANSTPVLFPFTKQYHIYKQ
ncbi:MAG: DUF1295 domain-containing protein [Holdemanella sp.]|nr:DUF1295 domain-containing protein [Holdemanella sp.]